MAQKGEKILANLLSECATFCNVNPRNI